MELSQIYFKKSLRVHRSANEYIYSIGMIFFCLSIFLFGNGRQHITVLLPIFLFFIANLIYLVAIPIMSCDGKIIVISKRFFSRGYFELESIKAVRLYEYVSKTIISHKQARQNNTLIIELKNGDKKTMRHGGLTKPVRERISKFLKKFNLILEIIDNE